MKHIFLLLIISTLIFSCKKNVTNSNQPFISSELKSSKFEINGRLENFFPEKVYLNKIIENSIYQIDSCIVNDNSFVFNGIVEFPERFALTFQNYSSIAVIIIENTTFDVFIDGKQISDPIVNGSNSNILLQLYKTKSKQIFKKIDFLYPQFQKARLENDAKKLSEIGLEMTKIEQQFSDFSFEFIQQNSQYYVAAMILRDQLKLSNIDTIRIRNTYNLLSENVKKSPDSQIIESLLKLH